MTTKLIRIAAKALLSLLLVVIVGALAVLTVVPRAVDGAALTVLTGSMTPTIPVGSVVVVRPVDPGTLHVGDVVTYQKAPGRAEFVTHRITAIHAETDPVTLTTKGDANRGPDTAPVPVTAVRGKVLFHVPYLGTFRNAVGTGGFGLLLVMVALVGYSVSQLLSALRDRRHGTAAPLPRSSPEPGLQVQLLVASLPTASFTTLLPQHAAHLLQMDLLAEGTETFTVAACGVPAKLDQLVELLQLFAPVELVRSEVVSVPHCTSESRQRLAVDSAS